MGGRGQAGSTCRRHDANLLDAWARRTTRVYGGAADGEPVSTESRYSLPQWSRIAICWASVSRLGLSSIPITRFLTQSSRTLPPRPSTASRLRFSSAPTETQNGTQPRNMQPAQSDSDGGDWTIEFDVEGIWYAVGKLQRDAGISPWSAALSSLNCFLSEAFGATRGRTVAEGEGRPWRRRTKNRDSR